MFLTRLFRRRGSRLPSETDAGAEAIVNPRTPFETNPHGTIAHLITRTRPLRPVDRVGAAVRLVDALRRLEEHQQQGSVGRNSQQVFIAMALRELDQLVDSMSYEELWDAFGGQFRQSGLQEEDIHSIPIKEITKEQAGSMEDTTCAVCLTEFSEAETVRELPGCCHIFHSCCIDKWLAKKASCPMCRQEIERPVSAFEV